MNEYTIETNRGNSLTLNFSIQDEEGEDYIFQDGDIVTFGIYEKKGLNKEPVLYKNYTPVVGSNEITISATKEEMTIGEMINKKREYWYEISLNDETIIGYDYRNAKKLILYPEGKKPNEYIESA